MMYSFQNYRIISDNLCNQLQNSPANISETNSKWGWTQVWKTLRQLILQKSPPHSQRARPRNVRHSQSHYLQSKQSPREHQYRAAMTFSSHLDERWWSRRKAVIRRHRRAMKNDSHHSVRPVRRAECSKGQEGRDLSHTKLNSTFTA